MIPLIVIFAITFATAAAGGLASRNAQDFYGQLIKPGWAPPPWLFGPVWTVLYILMAIAAWMVWKSGDDRRVVAMALFAAQLLLNGLWTWLFFAWRNGNGARWEILALIFMVIATAVVFYRIRPVTGLMLLPYLIWCCFAAALTFSIVGANPTMLGTKGGQ